jgi:hypothetical protein|eukprot:g6675.t1
MAGYATDRTPLVPEDGVKPSSSIFCCFSFFYSSKPKASDRERLSIRSISPLNVPRERNMDQHRSRFYNRINIPAAARADKPDSILDDIRSPVLRGGPRFASRRLE